TYNMPLAVQLQGHLDTTALATALADVVNRQETLRTVFTSVDGVPQQVVLPAQQADLGWEVVDACAWTPKQLSEAIDEVAGHAFDLSAEIPLRARLFRRAEDEHILVAVVHHIAADGWSITPLVTDL
ncbi:condensation domain-containing protein, partial [Mycolicibacterium sp. BiH015]|uniref:condensation domain-containing protein n=1 Tax=Mycolicibacterium sp. BiH015 TaxID=3018808 RepID=UPI0022E5189A